MSSITSTNSEIYEDISIETLIRNAESYPDDFASIGDQEQKTVDKWFSVKMAMSTGSYAAAVYFIQVPEHLRSLRICKEFVSKAPRDIGKIDPALIGYPNVVLIAINNDESALNLIHPSHKTADMVKRLIVLEKGLSAIMKTDWAKSLLTPEQVEASCRQNPKVALEVSPDLLTDKALADLAIYNINIYNPIRIARRMDLLVRPLSQGHWPHRNLVTSSLEKPTGLVNGVRHLLKAITEDHRALYMAYLMTHPIDKVVRAMKGGKASAYLLEMYSIDELKPHLKSMSLTQRGKILENDLGM